MSFVIAADENQIQLDGQAVPGVLTSITVKGQIVFDSKQPEGGSGRQYTLNGWDDAVVSVNLILLNDEMTPKEDSLRTLIALFRKSDGNGDPVPYVLSQRLADAWGIQRVFFQDVDTVIDNRRDQIACTLNFSEYRPAIAAVQQQKKARNEGVIIEQGSPPQVYTDIDRGAFRVL